MRKQNLETRAAAFARETSNAAAMPLGDLPDKGEAKTCAVCSSAASLERLEDLFPVAL